YPYRAKQQSHRRKGPKQPCNRTGGTYRCRDDVFHRSYVAHRYVCIQIGNQAAHFSREVERVGCHPQHEIHRGWEISVPGHGLSVWHINLTVDPSGFVLSQPVLLDICNHSDNGPPLPLPDSLDMLSQGILAWPERPGG